MTLQASSSVSVPTTTNPATLIIPEAVPGVSTRRGKLTIQNLGLGDLYIGGTNAVTTSTGIKIPSGQQSDLTAEEAAGPVYGTSSSGTLDIRILPATGTGS